MTDLKLCYIEEPWAFFTDNDLPEQWGDDWNDAPYQHNAEPPYGDNGTTIVKVAYDGPLETPAEYYTEVTGYSVEAINSGAVPWLQSCKWSSSPKIRVLAGASLGEFTDAVEKSGGNVYRATS